VQFDDFNVCGTTYDPEDGLNSFKTNSVKDTETDYNNIIFQDLAESPVVGGLFWRDASGTPSTGTGNASGHTGSYYYYAETSSGTDSVF